MPLASLVPGANQALVRATYLSLDPAMREWIREDCRYIPSAQIGQTMPVQGLDVVVEGRGETEGMLRGWAEYAVVDDNTSTKVDLLRTLAVSPPFDPLPAPTLVSTYWKLKIPNLANVSKARIIISWLKYDSSTYVPLFVFILHSSIWTSTPSNGHPAGHSESLRTLWSYMLSSINSLLGVVVFRSVKMSRIGVRTSADWPEHELEGDRDGLSCWAPDTASSP
ncbi:hypothetical protein FIBSPDRAFT_969510 [Athelia psychrophila]|uniref:Oxidoreductase N-terminal domain-containing protein n=1 Tax=Athelia psychrophila TaxID=1759441 RepID=A0A167TFS6_9AGAM|nr:hypothetical protein FIBSPDRAFT_969510 [Fibularhizoctonia sp. CBS 109695]